ncbi:hypothetical protein FHR81_005025 [Actinoalloteichus hoggarensis]|uniref:Uncharacterized protein n=1 Tax=Actinoalloteichus hoggarensis TaxID=1470176 RepID=A0A221W7T6_9PSEU|nr:DUF2264 domain-containing protein [Actinoalloteichus hoggarensis]ASO21968.1 hypothetical protein AHOG_21760 [Actinoalloteichus hoggarensis]MBB5923952.1 hypothetical protein [Actinoalloteichus hoggarensis]
MSLPDEDRALSPFTGWTRAHWAAVADRMLLGVRPHASPTQALLRLPGSPSRSGAWSDGLEGFARTFLAAAFRVAGSGGDDPHGFLDRYAAGLAAGTDPTNPERWPTFAEAGQAKVEAASIVIGLHETRPWLWDRLDDGVRERVVTWLAGQVGEPSIDNNWIWFQNVTEAFLRSVGGPWSQADLERNCELTESWHRGGGWYTDGGLRKHDFYTAWAFHLYPLWWCRMAPDLPLAQEYRSVYLDRLAEFLPGHAALFGADGAPLFQGRSLTYRWAALAPVWVAAVFDSGPFDPGMLRRWASGTLRYFLDRGALDDDDVLTTGWHGSFPALAQWYSGPASPYWASKGMLGLLLPEDHPVWTSVEQPLPVERADFQLDLPGPGWLVSGTKDDGIVRVANHGTDRASDERLAPELPVYTAFAFSTHTAVGLDPAQELWRGRGLEAAPADSAVVLLDERGEPSMRPPVRPLGVVDGVAFSRHRAHWPVDSAADVFRTGPTVTVGSVLRGAWEVRLIRVEESTGAAEEPMSEDVDPAGLRLRVSGWPVAGEAPPEIEFGPDGEVISAGGPRSRAVGLLGLVGGEALRFEGVSAVGRYSAVSTLVGTGPVEPGRVYAAAFALSGRAAGTASSAAGSASAADVAPAVDVAISATATGSPVVVVRWGDGRTQSVEWPS